MPSLACFDVGHFGSCPEWGIHKPARDNALGLMLRVLNLALKGPNKSAQGNALGLVMRVLKLALKGPNKSAQGNALGLQATPWVCRQRPGNWITT
jgi:hypothetical protein